MAVKCVQYILALLVPFLISCGGKFDTNYQGVEKNKVVRIEEPCGGSNTTFIVSSGDNMSSLYKEAIQQLDERSTQGAIRIDGELTQKDLQKLGGLPSSTKYFLYTSVQRINSFDTMLAICSTPIKYKSEDIEALNYCVVFMSSSDNVLKFLYSGSSVSSKCILTVAKQIERKM